MRKRASQYAERVMSMKRKISIVKLALPLASICLMIWTFSALSRPAFQDLPLTDTRADSHGWGGYEIRTGPGEAVPVTPRYTGEGYELSDESYDAVRRSRIMVEGDLFGPELNLYYGGRGIELFLDGQLFYSDFQTDVRDSNGFLLLGEENFVPLNEFRDVTVSLPIEYMGKTLTMIVYYPYADTWGTVFTPVLCSGLTPLAAGFTSGVVPVLWQVFWGVMMVLMAVSCAGSMGPESGGILWAKYALLLAMYAVFFVVNAYNSNMGFYSGFSGRIDGLMSHAPFQINTIWPVFLILCALVLLCLELKENKREKRKLSVGWTALFALAGLWIDAMQNSSELGDGIWGYLPVLFQNLSWGNWAPMAAMISSVIIYTITMQAIVQFISRRMEEWKDRSRLLERSRFARENYEMIMRVDEDSRRRKHEMKHHMQTIRSLLSAREAEKAEEYIERLIQETNQFAETTYSENIVVNAIVGIRLNQAKKEGIAVQSHIHVPVRMGIDDVDLNSLLSNLLENAIEACMRMEDRAGAYINLEIRKNQRFLFIECENSVDPGESLEAGQATVKGRAEEHGFGLKIMGAVAEKYAGVMQIQREPGRFVARTNLCLPE